MGSKSLHIPLLRHTTSQFLVAAPAQLQIMGGKFNLLGGGEHFLAAR